jgi:ABC-type spermidine/putrescine transport system permease subunit II
MSADLVIPDIIVVAAMLVLYAMASIPRWRP